MLSSGPLSERLQKTAVYASDKIAAMPRIAFDQLPSDARLWIFAAERPLSAVERDRVLAETDAFIDQWTAHGVPLTAARDVRYDQFVLVGVDERAAGVSGCSVDALAGACSSSSASLVSSS